MKELDKLIEYYNKRAEMYSTHSMKKKEDTDKAFNDGIAEGFRMAVKELEKANKLINEKLKALF